MELLVPIVIDCWVDNMKLTYDNITRTTTNNPGVDIRIPDFGNSTSVEWIDPSKASAGNYFSTIAEGILKFGYERNVSLRGAPYDFRKAPSKKFFFFFHSLLNSSYCLFKTILDELQDFFVNMKALVEDTFTQTNGQKIVFITHSMGSPMTLYFLNRQTQEWKNKYIKTWISLAGCWGGTIKALKVFAQGRHQSSKFRVIFCILNVC
jgi:lysophospholipase-3